MTDTDKQNSTERNTNKSQSKRRKKHQNKTIPLFSRLWRHSARQRGGLIL